MKVLLTGASGFVGGHVLQSLLTAGAEVRCLVRDARRLQGRPWSDQVQIVEGDALRPETLAPAMESVWATYYLIHSLTDTKEYRQQDQMVARDFGRAAKAAGFRPIKINMVGPKKGASGYVRTGVTNITKVVSVSIFLAGVGHIRTIIGIIGRAVPIPIIITDITDRVIVRIQLINVGYGRTVVHITADPVAVSVIVRVVGTVIAHVADAIAV